MQLSKRAIVLMLSALLTGPVFAGGKPEHGGQLVDVQGHHFELVVEPEAKTTHLDLFISDPENQPVTTATVKLQITDPSGQKSSLPLKYEGNHYTAVLSAPVKGEYRVVALATISGKKLNSRFNFKL
ncbi:MAG: hypothetical protein H7Y22_13040 [Gemmatimonadaceae bacterium]|nr:hypothetical protein [Gloeobacterales cyanobacterium ES-bin-141]